MTQPPTSQASRRHRSVAREAAAGYHAGDDDPGRSELGAHGLGLADAVDAVVAVPVDELDETEIHAELASNDLAVKRLTARNGQLAAALAARQAQRLRDADPGERRPRQRAERDVAADLQQTLNWTRAQARSAMRTTDAVATLPETRAALDGGQITDRHAKVIADTVDLLDEHLRQALEAELTQVAKTKDAVEFGRAARRRLAEIDPDAFLNDHDRKHRRRFARTWTEPDGMLRISAGVYGIDAEYAATAIDAFRKPDGPNDLPLEPQQRSADALVAALKAGLEHVDSTDHGARPHVILVRRHTPDADPPAKDVTTSPEDAAPSDERQSASAGGWGWPTEGMWTGPIPAADADLVQTDASISTVELDQHGAPVRSGVARPNIPAATWRALVVRDRHCTWPGCDAPPGWCDGAHVAVRWIQGAGNSVAELALACRRHHRIIDRNKLVGRLVDGRIRWFKPDQLPDPSLDAQPSDHGAEQRSRDGPDQRPRDGPDP